MPEILILIHGNIFYKWNLNQISINEKSWPDWRDPDHLFWSQYQYYQVFVGDGFIKRFSIPFHNKVLYDKITKLGIPIIKPLHKPLKTPQTSQNEPTTKPLLTQQTLHRRNPMQSRKKNLRIQTINQNKWWSKRPFLSHVRAQTLFQFFPSHSNQTHTLQKIPQTIRICSHFQNKPCKTTPRILSDLIKVGEHHITRK